MKILVFTSCFPNHVFPNHSVYSKERMNPFWKVNGFEMKVVAPVPYSPPVKITHRWKFSQIAKRERIEAYDVYHPRYFITPKIGMSLYGILMFLGALRTVKRIRKEFDFDIIDAHFVYPDGYAAVLLGRYFGKPVVVTSHGTDINLYPRFPLIRSLLRYTLTKADRVITVSKALKDAMLDLDIRNEKISVIPNGIDLGKFYPYPKEEARIRLGLPNKKVILSVGALIPRKGYGLLLKALKILIEKYHVKDLYVAIVGEGPSRGEIEKMIVTLGLHEYVRLVGSVPHDNLYLWYSAADLFCLTSSREGWACVLIESLACGTPAVATNVWGAPELICSDKYGLLTELDERDIADKIFLALDKRWDRNEIVEYARGYTWERATKEIQKVYNFVLGCSGDAVIN